jgi:hypothetical protein
MSDLSTTDHAVIYSSLFAKLTPDERRQFDAMTSEQDSRCGALEPSKRGLCFQCLPDALFGAPSHRADASSACSRNH